MSVSRLGQKITSHENKREASNIPIPWKSEYISNYDTFIFDCDGVLYKANEPVLGAKQVLHTLINSNKQVLFLSNNATKDSSTYQTKLKKLFSLDINPNNIFTSGISTALYLERERSSAQNTSIKILLIGSKGLYDTILHHTEFKESNILWTTSSELNSLEDVCEMKLDADVRFVVVSLSLCFRYIDMCIASRYLNELQHTSLIGTNRDATFPRPNGVYLAGSGSIIAAVKSTMPNHKKFVCCGKPEKMLFDLIVQKHPQIVPQKTLMVGDRIDTDIEFGKRNDLDTMLVMTGVTRPSILEKSSVHPKYVLAGIHDMLS